MATTKKKLTPPAVPKEEEKEVTPAWHPERVQERFEKAEISDDMRIYIAACFRKASDEMSTGVSVQRAFETVAEEIENTFDFDAPEENAKMSQL